MVAGFRWLASMVVIWWWMEIIGKTLNQKKKIINQISLPFVGGEERGWKESEVGGGPLVTP